MRRTVPLLALALLFSPGAFAAADSIYNGSRIIDVKKSSAGVSSLIRTDWIDRVTGAKYSTNRVVHQTKAMVATAAKRRLFPPNPWSLAITAAMIASDYYVNTNDETVEIEGDPALATAVGSCWRGGTGFASGSRTRQQCSDYIGTAWSGCGLDNTTCGNETWYRETRADWTGTGLACPSTAPCLASMLVAGTLYGYVETVHRTSPSLQYRGWWAVARASTEQPQEGAQPPAEASDEQIADAILNSPAWADLVKAINYDHRFDDLDQGLAEIAAMIADVKADLDNHIDGNPLDAPINAEDTGVDGMIQQGSGTNSNQGTKFHDVTAEQLANMVEQESALPLKERTEIEGEVVATLNCEGQNILACMPLTNDNYIGDTPLPVNVETVIFAENATCPSLPAVPGIDWTPGNENFCDALEASKPVVLAVASFVALSILFSGVVKV